MVERAHIAGTNGEGWPFFRWLRMLSLTEGVSTLLLFGVAMPLKYLADLPMVVTVVGTLHGGLFVGLVVMFVVAIPKIQLPPSVAALGILAAFFPFGPFIFDHRLRNGRQDQDAAASAVPEH